MTRQAQLLTLTASAVGLLLSVSNVCNAFQQPTTRTFGQPSFRSSTRLHISTHKQQTFLKTEQQEQTQPAHHEHKEEQRQEQVQLDSYLVQDMQLQYHEFLKEEASATTDSSSAVEVSSKKNNDNRIAPTEQEIFMARCLLLGAAALYGTNFSLVKLLGETDMSIGMSSTVRFGMATLACLPWLVYVPNKQKKNSGSMEERKDEEQKQSDALAATTAGFEVGIWNSLGYVAQAIGLGTTAASKSAFLCSLAVVTVPLLDKFVLGKDLKGRQMVGTIMALLGVAFLELGDLDNLHWTTGDLCSLVQPLAFGMGFWRMEHAMRNTPDQANRSTAAQLTAVFVASALYAAYTDPTVFWHPQEMLINDLVHNPTILAGLFWTGVISTALTVYMETVALKTLSAAETTLIFSTEPLWGTAFAAVVMGEQLGLDAGMGALLILSGCVFSNLGWNGIQEILFQKKKNQEQTAAAVESTAQTTMKTQTTEETLAAAADKFSYDQKKQQPKNLLPVFSSAATPVRRWQAHLAASSFAAWNSMSVATKVMALEMEDFLQVVFPAIMEIDP